MSASLSLSSVRNDATLSTKLRVLADRVFPDGVDAARQIAELVKQLEDFRNVVTGTHVGPGQWTADAVAKLAAYARALVDVSQHPRCGFVARVDVDETQAEVMLRVAERRLRQLCPDVSELTDRLALTLEMPVDQARVLAVWSLGPVPQDLTSRTVKKYVELVRRSEGHYRDRLAKGQIDDVAKYVAGWTVHAQYIPERDNGNVLAMFVASHLLIQRGYVGPHYRRVRLAASLTAREVSLRFRDLEPHLLREGTGPPHVGRLQRALLNYSADVHTTGQHPFLDRLGVPAPSPAAEAQRRASEGPRR